MVLQQYLPLAVLKHSFCKLHFFTSFCNIAIVLTACGIETLLNIMVPVQKKNIAIVLTACGIETFRILIKFFNGVKLQQYLPLAVLKPPRETMRWLLDILLIAIVLTACGIETVTFNFAQMEAFILQQYLPLAVLKRH